MTYAYKIGYYSMEESDYVELQHDNKFGDEELTEIIANAVVETIKKLKETCECVHSFQGMYCFITQYLLENCGFKRIKYQFVWSTFGWGSVFDNDNWGDDRGEHLNKITDAVNKAGYTRKDDDFLRREDEINKPTCHFKAPSSRLE